jgi:hypothetical protein
MLLHNSYRICVLSHIPLDAYDRYVKATGAVYDNTTDFLRIPITDYNSLKPLIFTVDDTNYVLNRNAQIIPRTFNTQLGGDLDHFYLIVFDLGNVTGLSKLEFIVGMAFLQRFYSVCDIDNRRVGLASTRFTNATDIN